MRWNGFGRRCLCGRMGRVGEARRLAVSSGLFPPGGHGLQLNGASFDQKTSATWPRTALTAL
jgi:hypothetical protein